MQEPRLKKYYQDTVKPELKKQLKLDNDFAVPTIKKIVINVGITQPQDAKARRDVIDNFVEQYKIITGQQPMITRAAKSISNYKLRQDDPVGIMVTLRGRKMWEFMDKLISIALPRVKDFRGVSAKAFDGRGNYSMGLEEQIIFPELEYDQIKTIKGFQVNIITDTTSNEHAKLLLDLLGVPFEKDK